MRLREIRPLNEANFVNPDSIDHWVRELTAWQSAFQKDPTLTAWLAKRLRQHFTSMTDAEAGKIMQKMPGDEFLSLEMLVSTFGDWVRQALDRGETLFWFDHTPRLGDPVRHVIDYVASLTKVATTPDEHETSLQQEAERQLRKITRLTFRQAEAHADQWFARLQAAGREHAERADQTGTKPVMAFHDGFRWVEITDTRALDREGDLMGHCVGGGSYDRHLTEGRIKIYSLRDTRNQPHVTVEVSTVLEETDANGYSRSIEGDPTIVQIKGKQNEGPSPKYAHYIGPLINGLTYNLNNDALHDISDTGLFQKVDHHGTRWGTISQVGDLIGEAGNLRVMAAGMGGQMIVVARGDVPMIQFGIVKRMEIGRYKLFGNDIMAAAPDLQAAVQILLDTGYSFRISTEYFLNTALVAIRNGRAVLVSDLPPIAERDGYSAVRLDVEDGWKQTLLWILGDGVAAHFRLEPTPFVLQVDYVSTNEVVTLPLARVVADAFNALMVGGVANSHVGAMLGRLIHRTSGEEPWQPIPQLLGKRS